MKHNAMFTMIFLLSLTACSFAPVIVVPDKTYTIDTDTASYKATHKSADTLLVASVQVPPELEEDGMLYVQEAHQIQYFTQNRWVAPPAKMLQPLIVRALEQTNYYQAVVAPPSIGIINYTLMVSLDKFQQVFANNTSVMDISMSVTVINNQSRKIVAHRVFAARAPTQGGTPYAGVLTANAIFSRLLNQIAEFTVSATPAP